jgi:hypothetical protein
MSAPVSTPPDSRKAGLVLVAVMAALMWVLEIIDSVLGGRLDALGIEPRRWRACPASSSRRSCTAGSAT